MLRVTYYSALDRVSRFVAAFNNHYREHEKTAYTAEMHTPYKEILDDVTRHIRLCTWNEKELNSPERRIDEFRSMALGVLSSSVSFECKF